MNRVTFGHNNWFQLRASYNRDQGWGTRLGLRNVPGPDKLFPLIDFSNDYLDWGRSEFGGSGNYLWNISDDLTWVKSRHTMKAGFTFQEDRYDGYGWHTAAGTYNFNRGATAAFLGQRQPRRHRRQRQRLRQLPARRGPVVRDHDQPLRLGSVALLLGLRPGRLADQQQADPQLRRPLRVHAADVRRLLPGRLLELQPGPAEPGARAATSARPSSPATGPAAPARGRCTTPWPWGFSPRLGAVYSLNDETVLRLSAARIFGSVKNTGGSSHWQGFIGGYNVTAPAFPASSAFNWDAGWPSWPEPPFLVPQTLNGSNIPYWQPYDSGRLPE